MIQVLLYHSLQSRSDSFHRNRCIIGAGPGQRIYRLLIKNIPPYTIRESEPHYPWPPPCHLVHDGLHSRFMKVKDVVDDLEFGYAMFFVENRYIFYN